MNTLEAIVSRRSIRRFQKRAVSRETITTLLEAAVRSPSAKNLQPWRFVVLEGVKKDELVQIMLDKARALRADGVDTGSLEWTAEVMSQAPATILIFNACSPENVPASAREDYLIVTVQSIGGAIQSLLLAAQDLGLGTLWIYDVCYAHDEVLAWLRRKQRLIAAVSVGYPDETPGPRPRHPWQEITEWLSA
jgi:nitroreductase